MSFVAPAGISLSLRDLVRGGIRSLHSEARGRLETQLCDAAGRSRAHLVSSGRAAMVWALEAMKLAAADARRTEVVFPGYTCYSVPAAVEIAGLVPRIIDVDPTTLSPDLDSLHRVDFSRVLAIVSANLYGMPDELLAMESLARERGVFMLDDAAQSMGARLGGRPVGGFGDMGLFSFDKGKNITTLQGGALMADSDKLWSAVVEAGSELLDDTPAATVSLLLKLPVYVVMLRPHLYGLVRRLPIGLGLTPYDTGYPIAEFSRTLTGLASLQLERLQELNAVRIRNADRLRAHLRDVNGVTIPKPLADSEPVYPRFPVLVDPGSRAGLISTLERAGIGATASYPKAMVDVPQVMQRLAPDQRETPGARDVAARIVTLPTHGYVPAELPGRVAALARAYLGTE